MPCQVVVMNLEEFYPPELVLRGDVASTEKKNQFECDIKLQMVFEDVVPD